MSNYCLYKITIGEMKLNQPHQNDLLRCFLSCERKWVISEGAAVSQLEPSLQCWAPAGWSGCCTVNTAVLQPAQSVSQHQNTQRDCLVIKEGASSPEIRQIHCRAVNYGILYGISVVVWVSSGVTNKDKTTLQFNLIIRDCNARLSHSQWWITNNKLVFYSYHHPQD